MFWKQLAGNIQCRKKLQGVCEKDKWENKLETVPLQARSEEYWKQSCRWLFEQLLFVPQHVTLSQKAFSVASQHSISLVDIKWGTVMSPQSRCVTCYVRKFPAFSRERFPLVGTECFENSWQETYNIEGSCKVWSCKVYVGKTNWKTSWKLCPCKARSEEYWKHSCRWLLFEQLLFVPKHATLSQKAFSVASQHSISLVDIKWGTVMSPQSRCVTCYVFFFWTLLRSL